MKTLLLTAVLFLSACASQQKNDDAALKREYLRLLMLQRTQGIPLTPQQQADAQMIGESSPALVEHHCSSVPIYDAWGNYVRTSTKCW